MDCVVISRDSFVSSFGGDTEESATYYGCMGAVFSAVRRGDSIVIHVGCKRENMRNLRKACNAFIEYMLNNFKWCNMLIATVDLKRQSVINLCRKLGFIDTGDFEFEYGTAKVMVKTR